MVNNESLFERFKQQLYSLSLEPRYRCYVYKTLDQTLINNEKGYITIQPDTVTLETYDGSGWKIIFYPKDETLYCKYIVFDGEVVTDEPFQRVEFESMGLPTLNLSFIIPCQTISNDSITPVHQTLHEVTDRQTPIASFKEVTIGVQIWMAENLNVDHYRNGDPIPEVRNSKDWARLTTGAWCYHGNDPGNGKKHGKLYNWYAVNDSRGLAPKGWHIPTEAEFVKLQSLMLNDGNALKAIGEGNGEGAGTNTSGFSALLSGDRYPDGSYWGFGGATVYWISMKEENDSSYGVHLIKSYPRIAIRGIEYQDDDYRGHGFSVRCVKDEIN